MSTKLFVLFLGIFAFILWLLIFIGKNI